MQVNQPVFLGGNHSSLNPGGCSHVPGSVQQPGGPSLYPKLCLWVFLTEHPLSWTCVSSSGSAAATGIHSSASAVAAGTWGPVQHQESLCSPPNTVHAKEGGTSVSLGTMGNWKVDVHNIGNFVKRHSIAVRLFYLKSRQQGLEGWFSC